MDIHRLSPCASSQGTGSQDLGLLDILVDKSLMNISLICFLPEEFLFSCLSCLGLDDVLGFAVCCCCFLRRLRGFLSSFLQKLEPFGFCAPLLQGAGARLPIFHTLPGAFSFWHRLQISNNQLITMNLLLRSWCRDDPWKNSLLFVLH